MQHNNSESAQLTFKARNGRTILWGLAAVTTVVLIIGAWVLINAPWGQQTIPKDSYQAVYLTTGQMYFGKLQNTTGSFLTLSHPYTTQRSADGEQATQNETTLVKLTQQVYGPDDSIALRSEQVQFWQNLRSDSKVVQTIEAAK